MYQFSFVDFCKISQRMYEIELVFDGQRWSISEAHQNPLPELGNSKFSELINFTLDRNFLLYLRETTLIYTSKSFKILKPYGWHEESDKFKHFSLHNIFSTR